MLTHRNIVSNVLMTTAGMPELSWNNGLHRQGDTVLGVLPFYHIYGKCSEESIANIRKLTITM